MSDSDTDPEAVDETAGDTAADAAGATPGDAVDMVEADVTTKRGLSAGKIAAIVVIIVLGAGFVVGLIASKHEKDNEKTSTGASRGSSG